jgi:hypothetical protein
MRTLSAERQHLDMVKDIVRTIVDDIDAGINTDAARMNNYLSEPGKSKATKEQKARMFAFVLDERYREDS